MFKMLSTLLSLVLAALLALGCSSGASTPTGGSAAGEETAQAAPGDDSHSTSPDDRHAPVALSPKVLGDEAAPVHLVEYADFQCIWCARAYEEVWPQLQPLVESGQLRYEYRHRIVINDNSLLAAEASECAAEQGKFWEYLDELFTHYSRETGLNRDILIERAETAGLDVGHFRQCLDSRKYTEAVAAQDQEGRDNSVTGTPAWLINGELFRPQESLQEVVTAVQSAIEGAQETDTP